MDLVIDIQCCKDAKSSFVAKEVAVVSIEGNHIAHWLVLPPYSAKKLPINIRAENKWLRQSLHGLDWEEGFITKTALHANLNQITKNFDKVYVRGKEKKRILEKIILNEIINLEEDTDNPSFDSLPWNDSFCLIHSTRMTHVAYNCALNYANRLRNWLREQPLDLTINKNEQFTDIEDIINGT